MTPTYYSVFCSLWYNCLGYGGVVLMLFSSRTQHPTQRLFIAWGSLVLCFGLLSGANGLAWLSVVQGKKIGSTFAIGHIFNMIFANAAAIAGGYFGGYFAARWGAKKWIAALNKIR